MLNNEIKKHESIFFDNLMTLHAAMAHRESQQIAPE
jgi:hypothetical protein